MMGLRLLILRSVEMLSQVDKKHRKVQSDVSRSNLLLSLALFTETVDVVRRSTTNLQFASLFLEVGRQIEPSFLAHLFPLPHSRYGPLSASPTARRRSSNVFVADKSSLDRFNARTVVELFSLCIHEGSLSASASALPLLSSRMQARAFCDLLLERAMDAFCHNIDSTEADFDRTMEERRVIGDIFRFGVKLEDAAEWEERMLAEELRADRRESGGVLPELDSGTLPALSASPSGNTYTTDDSHSDQDYGRSNSHRNLICVGGGARQSTILGYVIHSIFDEGNAGKESEAAIRRAASSFIDSKRDLASMDFLSFGAEEGASTTSGGTGEDSDDDDIEEEEESSENGYAHPLATPKRQLSTRILAQSDPPAKTVASLVGNKLLELLKAPDIDHPWKAIASLSRLLLQQQQQQSKEVPSLKVYTKAVEQTSKAALEAVLPTGYMEDTATTTTTTTTYESSSSGGNTHTTVMSRFLIAEIGRCEFQLQPLALEPAWIVDLILLLLHRLQSKTKEDDDDADVVVVVAQQQQQQRQEQQIVVASMVLIGLIAGHVSGRTVDLLSDVQEDASNYLVQCYKKTVQQDPAISS